MVWAPPEPCANARTHSVLDEVNGTLIQTRGSLAMYIASNGRQARLTTWGWVVLSVSFPLRPLLSDLQGTDGDSGGGKRLLTRGSRCCCSCYRRRAHANAGIDSTQQRRTWVIYALPCCLSSTMVCLSVVVVVVVVVVAMVRLLESCSVAEHGVRLFDMKSLLLFV